MTAWPEIALADVVSSLGGLWGADEPGDGLVEVLALRGTDFARVRAGDLRSVPRRFEKAAAVEKRLLDTRSIVIEASGGSKDQPVGRSILIKQRLLDKADAPLSAASFCKILWVDRAIADPRFIHGVIQNLYQSGEIEQFQTQSTGLRNLRTKQLLADYRFRLPELEAQRRIAAVLLAFDELIEINERRIELLEDLARSLYREWFVQFRFPGHEDVELIDSELGPIPEGWEVRALREVGAVNAWTLKLRDLPDPFRYLDISTVGIGRIGSLPVIPAADAPGRARRGVRDGDVVWATVRPNRRAHALVHDPPEDLVASTGLAVLTPTGVPSSFLFEFASDRSFTDYLVSQTSGAAYPAVRPADFELAPAVVPPLGLLKAFDAAADPQLRLASAYRAHNESLAATRDLLLPRLVTGRLDISDLDLGVLTPPNAE